MDEHSEIVANKYKRLHPEYIPGSSWSNIIKNRCIAIFKERFAGYEPPNQSEHPFHVKLTPTNLVRLLTGEYFRRNFKAEKKEANELISDSVARFSLNEEQERAFRIIANHASAPATEQLKMYLGGMGGTGKTQVIKALIYLFSQRNKNHRFAVLAPTGTAAALLNGSTYHKALGIHRKNDVGQDFSRSESAVLNEVRARLRGVEYIFIDEVSMIACHELYSISARLAQITGMHDAPFGGMNIILAGDFAQLSPVFGSSLYDGHVEKYVNARMSVRDQEATIGKIL
jgi:ATP-dependent DNA helicase PIF1